MKKSLIFLILVIGGILGLVASLGIKYALDETSGDKFCIVCHEMDPMVISYNDDIHSGKGKLGVKAKCVDCHLPHDNTVKYILAKAKNGVVEGYIHFFGDLNKIDWVENTKKRESYVFDDGCLKCHDSILDSSKTSEKAQKMHLHYKKLLDTPKKIGCASCHFDAGHSYGLRNYLEYFKPTYKLYEKKMLQKKIEVKKRYFKDDYEPTKEELELVKSKNKAH